MKMPKFGTKNDLFGYFWDRIEAIVIFEISTLKFVINETLFHTVNFGIGSAFSKGPGSALSEGPARAPGPGLLYKVCFPKLYSLRG